MITTKKQISTHFHSTEFMCQHCKKIKIDENLVTKLEHIFSKLNASKCIISSGYRCDVYDKKIGGFLGRHYEGLAADCIFYDKNGKIIPSKIVICVAYDLNELKGMAIINENYVHLDNRKTGSFKGDETRGNSSYWTNPYTYFKVTKEDVEKYTNNVSYYKKYTGTSSSIVEALKSIGVDYSFSNRKKIATKNSITNYTGTASQNTKLLNLLKQGKLIKN